SASTPSESDSNSPRVPTRLCAAATDHEPAAPADELGAQHAGRGIVAPALGRKQVTRPADAAWHERFDERPERDLEEVARRPVTSHPSRPPSPTLHGAQGPAAIEARRRATAREGEEFERVTTIRELDESRLRVAVVRERVDVGRQQRKDGADADQEGQLVE